MAGCFQVLVTLPKKAMIEEEEEDRSAGWITCRGCLGLFLDETFEPSKPSKVQGSKEAGVEGRASKGRKPSKSFEGENVTASFLHRCQHVLEEFPQENPASKVLQENCKQCSWCQSPRENQLR